MKIVFLFNVVTELTVFCSALIACSDFSVKMPNIIHAELEIVDGNDETSNDLTLGNAYCLIIKSEKVPLKRDLISFEYDASVFTCELNTCNNRVDYKYTFAYELRTLQETSSTTIEIIYNSTLYNTLDFSITNRDYKNYSLLGQKYGIGSFAKHGLFVANNEAEYEQIEVLNNFDGGPKTDPDFFEKYAFIYISSYFGTNKGADNVFVRDNICYISLAAYCYYGDLNGLSTNTFSFKVEKNSLFQEYRLWFNT